ncbi:MAG: sodium/solute symporter [Deltaproteobacteria bacterium]|nr:sodium/solute symporter [Deltaproteobacteria bacterium]
MSGSINIAILILSLVLTFALGLYLSRRQKNVKDYFLAGRNMPFWAVGFSIIATQISGISYLGIPAFVFQKDLTIFLRSLTILCATIVIAFTLAPLFYRMNITSIYEYLERRFSIHVRVVSSLILVITKLTWLSMVIYASGLLLSTQFEIPLTSCIIFSGLFTTLYTAWGGMKADIWTDVIQFFLMSMGLIVAIAIILYHFNGDVGEIWRIASAGGHTVMVRDMANFNTEYSIWAILIGSFILNLFDYGGNQITVQRYLTTSSVKGTIKSLLLSAVFTLPFIIVISLLGLGLFAYYNQHPQMMQSLLSFSPDNPTKAMDRVFAHFIVNVIPVGLSGLVVSGIVAAGMSSADSGFNSLSAICFTDYYKRFFKKGKMGEHVELNIAKKLSLFWGLICTVMALFINKIGLLMEVANKIYSYFVGPIIALFFMGLFIKMIDATAAIVGMLLGLSMSFVLIKWTNVHFLWHAPFCFGVTIFSAVLFSLLNKIILNRFSFAKSSCS